MSSLLVNRDLLQKKESDFMKRASCHILEVSLVKCMDMIKTRITKIEECRGVFECVKIIRDNEWLKDGMEKFHARASGFDHENVIKYDGKVRENCCKCNKDLNYSKKSRICRDCKPVNSKKRKLVQESDSDE